MGSVEEARGPVESSRRNPGWKTKNLNLIRVGFTKRRKGALEKEKENEVLQHLSESPKWRSLWRRWVMKSQVLRKC